MTIESSGISIFSCEFGNLNIVCLFGDCKKAVAGKCSFLAGERRPSSSTKPIFFSVFKYNSILIVADNNNSNLPVKSYKVLSF